MTTFWIVTVLGGIVLVGILWMRIHSAPRLQDDEVVPQEGAPIPVLYGTHGAEVVGPTVIAITEIHTGQDKT